MSLGTALRIALLLIYLPACKADTRPKVTTILGVTMQGASKSNLLSSLGLRLEEQDVHTIYLSAQREMTYVVRKYRGRNHLEVTTCKGMTNDEERIVGVCVNCMTGGSVTNALTSDEVASMATPEKVRELQGVAPFMEMRGEIWHEIIYEEGFGCGAKYMGGGNRGRV